MIDRQLETLIRTTTEESAGKTDWTTAWSKRYPVLAQYQSEVDIPHYASEIRQLIEQLKLEHHYSEEDAFLVLKDILYHEMRSASVQRRKKDK